jgi:hypothetical protein
LQRAADRRGAVREGGNEEKGWHLLTDGHNSEVFFNRTTERYNPSAHPGKHFQVCMRAS